MKNKTTIWLVILLILALALFAYFLPREPKPVVMEDGRVSGNHSISQIMNLEKQYVCKFERSDDTTVIAGTIHTDGKNMYGEFRILSSVLNAEFNSYNITQGNKSYVWTSLQPVGQIAEVADSAFVEASPEEQAQIIGKDDKVQMECEPWENDPTVFEVPSWINFVEAE